VNAVAVLGGIGAVAAAIALVGARRTRRELESLRRSHAEFRRAVIRVGDAFSAAGDRETLVRVLLDTSRTLVGADSAVFWVDRGPSIDARAGSGVGGDGPRRVPADAGLVGAVAATHEPVRWPPGPPEPAAEEPRAAAAIAVPLLARGRLYGVVSLYRDSAPFEEGDLDDIVGLAHHAGDAIDASYLHDETRRLSLTDGLTGLWNRRQFELRIAQELERATRFGERFSIVIADLDDFKAINDRHGHLTGDAVLVETARRLVTHTREVDTVARYGGEEFVLLLPQTEGLGALNVAEKVRDELSRAPIETDAGALRVTLSAGVACHPHNGTSLEELLAAADAALYAAKASGKNRVVPADLPQSGVAPA
jgi:diguanylate cyclase (GGDEF)-like protein